uniref:Uncharacterized protein n=1 Tax=Aegilops tauschii subsp. strangulata TaxID=200361 RepID=A0A452XG06_AEGTS
GEPGDAVGDHRAGRRRRALRRRLVVLGRRRRLQRRPGLLHPLPARVKLWLFVAYVVSFVCLAGSVGLLVQDALTDKGPSVWTGVAGVLQCVFVLIRAGLLGVRVCI